MVGHSLRHSIKKAFESMSVSHTALVDGLVDGQRASNAVLDVDAIDSDPVNL